jgi:hypothetical protein
MGLARLISASAFHTYPGALCYLAFPHCSEARVEAERRQVTVLFADMVGFTSFSERSGEEAAFALMRSLWKLLLASRRDDQISHLRSVGGWPSSSLSSGPFDPATPERRWTRPGSKTRRATANANWLQHVKDVKSYFCILPSCTTDAKVKPRSQQPDHPKHRYCQRR